MMDEKLSNHYEKRKMIVGITGATGVVYGVRLLKVLKELDIESYLIVSKPGNMTRSYETDITAQELNDLADVFYHPEDFGAAISSGSFKTMGMIVAPCSMRSLSEIATGVTTSLLTRAADVVLKERRKLVLMIRETPLHLGHIRNMATVTEMGGIIAPPVPAFYTKPRTIDDLVNQSVGRVLDIFDLNASGFVRWKDPVEAI